MKVLRKIKVAWENPYELSYLFLATYLLVATAVIFKFGLYSGLDIIFLIFFIGALIIGKYLVFLRDWLPFLLMFFGYEMMRSVADNLTQSVHTWEMIKADAFLFGQIPTVSLQANLWQPNSLLWYDIAAYFFYISHFWFIFLVGFIIWFKKRSHFKAFSWSFIILNTLGFITYLLFPAMPPWMASNYQYVEGINRLLIDIGNKLHFSGIFTFLYKIISPNEIATMPSMHAAWAWFASLFLVYIFGKKLWPIFIIPVGLGFSLVYLGEHYVIDILLGIIYATLGFWVGKRFLMTQNRQGFEAQRGPA